MTALNQLNEYLRRVERRLRWQSLLRGAAVTFTAALGLTLIFTVVADHYRFADGLVPALRAALYAGVAVCVLIALVLPLRILTRKRIVCLAETSDPRFEQRLLTITENNGSETVFSELLAEDALQVTADHPPERFASSSMFAVFSGMALVCVLTLAWLITSGPGIWGYGASLLWTGGTHAPQPLYAISVEPGNKTLRRNSDQMIVARLKGFSTPKVSLRAKYRSTSKWETLVMQPNSNGGYQFVFPGLSDDLDYFVEAGESTSKHFALHVKDLPRVVHVKVAVHYPSGLGLRDVVDDPGGDIRAVEGTQATVEVQTDRPLQQGFLVLDDGSKVPLTPAANGWRSGQITVRKDGAYHIAAQDDELVRISDDYFIEAKKDEPPTVRITRPSGDPHATPIEELPVTVEAADDFGLHSLQLHYSANGGPEHVVPFPASGKSATGKTTIAFEDLHLQPGDLVSMFATASDGSKTTRSDIMFAQADAFDYKFRQLQQMSGGGQASQEDSRISDRQKEIIAATWNELKDGNKTAGEVNEHAKFLSDLQGKLGEQAQTMAERMGKRELGTAGPQFEQFSKLMQDASAAMSNAVQQLQPAKWQQALAPEQKALQALLRAESIFRDIQIAFGQRGSGGGRGSSGADRDLARMFDLELDTSKNQYESAQSGSPSQDDQQKKLDEALQKLKELARRQQEMAQNAQPQQTFQQRWEQEQLRREAEQLRQQMQQASAQQGQQAGTQQSANGQSGSSSQTSQQARQRASEQLRKAEDEMRKAASGSDAGARARAQRALEQAQKQLEDSLQAQAGSSLKELARKAGDLADRQRELADNVKKQYGAEGIRTTMPGNLDGTRMPEMAGPGYSSWYRRRLGMDLPQPATAAEKNLGDQGERLSRQTAELQRQMQDQLGQLTGNDPDAAKKLRQALSDAEQQELALRIQKGAEWLRSGHGSETWQLQDSVTDGMQQLARQVGEAQQALGNGGSPGSQMARTAAEIQQLQQQLAGGDRPGIGEAQQAMRDLSRLTRTDQQLGTYAADALSALRHVSGQNGLLDARVSRDAARSLQRLELELERRGAASASPNAHAGANDETPQQYKDQVAEYFRKLSK